jgi:predicted dehydrogenase
MIKCAIVGCGQIAGGYDTPYSDKVRTHAKAFLKHPSTKLLGVCDIDEKKAKKFAKVWNAPFSTNNISELLKVCKPDLLSICSPTDTHLPIFKIACRYGVPIIWLEKPATTSLKDVEKMVALAQENKIQVWVNYFRRYDVGFKKIKKLIDDLGPIQHAQAFYTKGLLHNGSHLIDLIHWFFGKINDVKLDGINNDNGYISINGILKTDKANIHLKALDYKKFELFEMDIIGNNGRIKVLDGGQKILFENIIKSKYYSGYRNLNLKELHDSSYGGAMLAGLKQGLDGDKMPGLDNEIQIQSALQKIILN